MLVNGILNGEDLEKISNLLEDNGYGQSNIVILIKVKNKEAISRINDDFFYRNNEEGTPPDVDEINVKVGNVSFKYVVEEGQ